MCKQLLRSAIAFLLVIIVTVGICGEASALTNDHPVIAQKSSQVQQSSQTNDKKIRPHIPIRSAKAGGCECPYDTDKAGRSCGKRSAYSRPNGDQPKCYQDD